MPTRTCFRIVRLIMRRLCLVSVAGLIPMAVIAGCHVHHCHHCQKSKPAYYSSESSGIFESIGQKATHKTSTNHSRPTALSSTGSAAQLAWQKRGKRYGNANKEFANGWQHGYQWAKKHRLGVEPTAVDSLPLEAFKSSGPQWLIGCRKGISDYVEGQTTTTPQLSSVASGSELPKKKKTGPFALSGTESTSATHGLRAPPSVLSEIPKISVRDPETRPRPTITTLRPTSEYGDHGIADTSSSMIDGETSQLSDTRQPNEPVVNPELARQMDLIRQIELARQLKAEDDTQEPLVDWVPIDVPTPEIDVNTEHTSMVKQQRLSTKANPLSGTEADRNDLRSTDADEVLLPATNPIIRSTESAAIRSVLVDSSDLGPDWQPLPRLIARPVSGLIHTSNAASNGKEQVAPSRAKFLKFLDSPILVPPSAIHALPAAEPIMRPRQWPGKIDDSLEPSKLKTLPEPVDDLSAPRQAAPADNAKLR